MRAGRGARIANRRRPPAFALVILLAAGMLTASPTSGDVNAVPWLKYGVPSWCSVHWLLTLGVRTHWGLYVPDLVMVAETYSQWLPAQDKPDTGVSAIDNQVRGQSEVCKPACLLDGVKDGRAASEFQPSRVVYFAVDDYSH
jgi:hypothetical protein